jgi:hypothetical protein
LAKLDEQIAEAKTELAQATTPPTITEERRKEYELEQWLKKITRSWETTRMLLGECPEGYNIQSFIGKVEHGLRPFKQTTKKPVAPTSGK